MRFTSSLKLKLIYVFRINDATHRGCLKIGEATCEDENVFGLSPNSKALNEAARKRINQYTQTAGIAYDLLYTELTIYNRGGLRSFNDKEVHNVLEHSGIKKKVFDTVNKANEWFITDLETVKRAIAAVKEGRSSLSSAEVTREYSPIVFRPEQQEAINKTKKQFRKGNQMLWNAKMRFGKTLSALQVVKDMEFQRTLILTHRPVVDAGWFEDFGKIFYDRKDFAYGSKNNGDSFASLERRAESNGLHYVYFASMQDLRGSELVGGNFDKNNEVFATDWDLIIVDEAHEGTQTELGKAVMGELVKEQTKVLRLSGTPFNLLDDFKEDEIYTWDYVMEQRAKMSWDELHFGDPNPYASLPTLNIYTYDLGWLLHEFVDEDVAFNFKEFFRVNESGSFCHEKDVQAFLNLLTKEDKNSLYPYANEEYRNIFRHTLWMVPGVKEARALSAMLQTHPVFQHFKVVNVAGDGDQDEESRDALEAVEQAIGKDPDATRTITLSCGRLTTGVSVKAWTAVFMLSGSYNTAASSYMQTIFRVQTPATINGRMKEQCYVFDFAPDRTLKVIAETAKISSKAGKTSQSDRKAMGEFINFCPIISIDGSQMNRFDVPRMLEQLKRVYVERVVRNGFEDNSLYNDELMKLDDLELQEFDDLKKIIGQTKAMPKTNQVDINSQGLNNEEYEEKEKLEKKPKKELTEEDRKRLEELKILKPFRKEMMEDKHIASIYDYEDSGECFNGQHIDGGICYFLWSNKHNGKLRYTYISTNKEFFVSTRFLSDGNSDIVIRDNRRQSIIAKTSTNCSLFKEIVSLTQPFGIRKDLFNSPERYPLSNLQSEPFYGCVKIYGVKGIKGGARRTIGYISPRIITKNKAAVNKYKLFFTTSYSTNAFNPPETIIGEQNSVCTETFLLIGPFDTEIEQKNCYKYICTNFFKTLLFFGRGTMQVSQDVFRFIPLQDFSNQSDINWHKSILEIDNQLYLKYSFTKEEILFIGKSLLSAKNGQG